MNLENLTTIVGLISVFMCVFNILTIMTNYTVLPIMKTLNFTFVGITCVLAIIIVIKYVISDPKMEMIK